MSIKHKQYLLSLAIVDAISRRHNEDQRADCEREINNKKVVELHKGGNR